MTDPRFPIGRFHYDGTMSDDQRRQAIDAIAAAPAALRAAVEPLSEAQLDTRYRDGGWTVRQVVHHVADSHLNAYLRTKLALTGDAPTITPYDEAAWAELSDSRDVPVAVSLALLDALHARWVSLLRALPHYSFARTVTHPEWPRPMTVDLLVALYAWHGRHHVGHVKTAVGSAAS